MKKLLAAIVILAVVATGVWHFRPQWIPASIQEWISAMLVKEAEVADGETSGLFPDVPAGTLLAKAVEKLRELKVIQGFPDGKFYPNLPVERAQVAKMLLKLRGNAAQGLRNHGRFSDVLEGSWYESHLIELIQRGIARASGGLLLPMQNVQKDQLVTMMLRAFNLELGLPHRYQDISSRNWAYEIVGVVDKYDLFPDSSKSKFEQAKQLSRGEVAIALYQYLRNK
ncbi:MAG: S-layer homology domain-containing protein [bacterium]|nr:S-layer homology domain-containing protein [bacterium]